TNLPTYQIRSLDFAARERLQFCLDHGVERPQVVSFPGGEAAMDLYRGEELGASDVQNEGSELFAGVGFNAPVAAEGAADHFTQVTAPQLAHLGKLFGGDAGRQVKCEAADDGFQVHERGFAIVEAGVELARDDDGLVRVGAHHGADGIVGVH